MSTYDSTAPQWVRDTPQIHSDFVGRPELVELARKYGIGKRILDIGCGEGYVTRQLAEFAKVVGIDISPSMIAYARGRERSDRRSIEYYVEDATALPFSDASFDIVTGAHVADKIKPSNLGVLYQEANRVLKPGGYFILLISHPAFAYAQEWGKAVVKEELGTQLRSGTPIKKKLTGVSGKEFEVVDYYSTLSDHWNAEDQVGLYLVLYLPLPFRHSIAYERGLSNPALFSAMEGKIHDLLLVMAKGEQRRKPQPLSSTSIAGLSIETS